MVGEWKHRWGWIGKFCWWLGEWLRARFKWGQRGKCYWELGGWLRVRCKWGNAGDDFENDSKQDWSINLLWLNSSTI